MNYKFFSLLTIAILVFSISSASAANEIIFDANKSSYGPGDIVKLNGTVKDSPNQLVAVEVKDPTGNTIVIRTVQTDDNGNFVLQFKLPSTAKTGNYNIVTNAEVNGSSVTQTKTIMTTNQNPTTQPSTTQTSTSSKGGGCLIATAAFGSELAPQVQMLREIRDNQLLKTQSGTGFMTGFNQFYYSFSPTVADWERANPVFKEMVKGTITPLITSLAILQYVPINSEATALFYGIGIILLNIGMYFVAPAVVVFKIKNHFIKKELFRSKNQAEKLE
jgi:hypothetical protein